MHLCSNVVIQQAICNQKIKLADKQTHTHTHARKDLHAKTERISRRNTNGYDLTWKSKDDFWSPVEAADYVCGGLDVCIRF